MHPGPFVSVHLPKAGGTSTRIALERRFGDRALFDYGRGPLGPRALEVEPGLPPGIALVHGHFRPGRYDAVKDAFRLTFLRHPVDLLVSFYFFWREMPHSGGALHRRFLDERPSIEAFAAWGPINRLSSETYFGGYDMGRFDFIGFHETRAEDFARLNAVAGLDLEAGVHVNRTDNDRDERRALTDDAGRMARLADILAEDVAFHDRLRARRG